MLFEDLGEAGVLGQEAVARMHGIGAGDLAGRDEGRDVEIAIAAGGGPMQTLSSASRTCMASASAVECTATVAMPSSRHARWMRSAISPRLAIRILSNMGSSPGVSVSTSPATPLYSMMISGSPYSTGWAFSTRIALTVPARGAGIWFIVFMASMMSSVSP